MYHDVLNDLYPKSGFQKAGAIQYAIDSRTFESHLRFAKNRDNVQFSFDDGGSSFYNVIAEMLERYGRRGIFYITTSYIGLEYFITEEQIKELDRRGHIIASHSHTHPKKISALRETDCLEEWVHSKKILKQILGHEVEVASVPGGAVSKMVIDCMIDAGYTEIYTSEPTTEIVENRGAKIYGRYGVKKATTIDMYKAILTDPGTRKKMLRHHKMLDIAKKTLGPQYNNLKQFVLRLKKESNVLS